MTTTKAIVSTVGVKDPVGMLLTATVGIASLFGVFDLLGWTADQVGAFLGFLGLFATGLATVIKAAKAPALDEQASLPSGK